MPGRRLTERTSAYGDASKYARDSSEYELLSEDGTPSTLPTNPSLLIDTFQKLRDEFRNRLPEGLNDHLAWLDHLRKVLGSDTVVKKYFEWVREQQRQYDAAFVPKDVSVDEIMRLLADIDWNEGNDVLKTFNSILWHTRCNSARNVEPLGWNHENFSVWLLVDGQPLAVPEVDDSTCEAYKIDLLNPGFVLGMRYLPVDDNKKKDLLVAPLGRIYLSRTATKNPCFYARLILLVEVLDDGKPGALFMVHDPDDDERLPLFSDQEKQWIGRGEPSFNFTVAKTSLHGFFSDCTSGSPSQSVDFAEIWAAESVLEPEIAAIGHKLRKRGTRREKSDTVALYPRDEVLQEGL